MTVVLFWNVKKGAAVQFLRAVCTENDVDIVVLAEDDTPPGYTVNLLNALPSASPYVEYAPVPSGIKFFTRLPIAQASMVMDPDSRVSIRQFGTASGSSILVAGVHLPSKLQARDIDQYAAAKDLRQAIEQAERIVGHSRSVVIGDMNMNPYEIGMIAYDGLHGLMDRAIVETKISKVYRARSWSFFYNPMWGRLGDESSGPPGTYFSPRSDAQSVYWHTFDQVLIRPSLLPHYNAHGVKVITQIRTVELLERGRMSGVASDHLPISIELNI